MVPEAQSLDAKLRFDIYEADSRSGELRKLGVRVPLEDRPFRALLILLRRANEVVTREELQKQLWPSDVFIDFDHGLNTVIRKIRLALNDRADNPRFIETLGRRGYRFLARVEQETRVMPEPAMALTVAEDQRAERGRGPDGAQNQTQVIRIAVEPASASFGHKRIGFWRRGWVLTIATGAMVLILAYVLRPAMLLPRVTRVTQLTKIASAWYLEPLYTDGPRVYYQSTDPLTGWQLRQVLLNGNEDTPAGIPAGRFRIRGLSPDDTEFVAITEVGSTVWRIPIVGGSPRRIGNLVAGDIAWSHDGNWFAYALGNQLLLANVDGASSRPLAKVPEVSGGIDHIRWSPDDGRIRFTAVAGTTMGLWEVDVNGRNLHEMRFNWPGNTMKCCGEWTPDGHYFVFRSNRDGVSDLFALEEKSDWWRRSNPDPVQLTFGPVSYYQPVPSRNGQSIFAIGVQPAGELVRYDANRKDFVPFLGGRSIAHLAFSRDGQRLAYVTYPEGALWRARRDGTEQIQLTFPPLQVRFPRWSADGERIAFDAIRPGQLWKNFVISAEGGEPEPFPAESLSQTTPDWMPGRDALIYSVYSGTNWAEHPALYLFDVRTGRSEKIARTDGLYRALWSPSGHYLAAVDETAGDTLVLFDLQSGKRTRIASPAFWPVWSPDSEYIYFIRWGIDWLFRVHVPDGREEKVLEVPLRVAPWPYTVAPDGSFIILREHGRYDVYALSLSRP